MESALASFVILLALLGAVHLVSERTHVPSPIGLAVAGLAFAVIPGMPRIAPPPGAILSLLLPVLLYTDAFNTSWNDFRRSLRPILMLAIGLVVFTTLVVGVVAHWVLPALPWTVCFLLGAVISPTDTVAVQAVIERLRVPRRITAVLGGESLVNDATGLVCVQVVTAVLLSGSFELGDIGWQFARVAGLGVAVGLFVGAGFALCNRLVRDTHVLFVLSIVSPYFAYLLAEQLACSALLAVVVAGFVVAWRIHQLHSSARVQLHSTWDQIIFVVNGLCFLFIGLETPHLIDESSAFGGRDALVAGLAITVAVVAARVLWCLPGALVAMPWRRGRPEFASWKQALLISWAGVRGVVSLAAAMTLPELTSDGRPFPGRSVIIACTLCVVLATLFIQGLTLRPLIHLLGIRDDEDTGAEVRGAREAVLAAGIERLDSFCTETACPLSVHHLRLLMVDELQTLQHVDADERQRALSRVAVSTDVRRAILLAQESTLLRLRDSGSINDKTYVKLLLELDRAQVAVPLARKAA